MILYVQSLLTKQRKRYILNNAEDFEEIFHIYPHSKDIALRSESLEDAATKIAKYLSDGSRFDAWLEGTMMKNIKQNAALALGMSLAPVSAGGRLLEQAPHYQVPEQEHNTEEFGKQPEDPFLWNIMQIESSGGHNTNHKVVKKGSMKGQTAIGRWGLLKPTVKDVLDRMKLKGGLTNDLRPLYTMDQSQLKQHFENNPSAELKIARSLARHVLDNNKGDEKRAAFSWEHGSNLTKDKIQDEQLNQSDYVNKFKHWHPLNPYKAKHLQVKKKLNKKESASDFKSRLKNWENERDEFNRKPMMNDSTFSPDPGRLRDPHLDQVKPKGVMGLIGWAIKQAKKDNKKD